VAAGGFYDFQKFVDVLQVWPPGGRKVGADELAAAIGEDFCFGFRNFSGLPCSVGTGTGLQVVYNFQLYLLAAGLGAYLFFLQILNEYPAQEKGFFYC